MSSPAAHPLLWRRLGARLFRHACVAVALGIAPLATAATKAFSLAITAPTSGVSLPVGTSVTIAATVTGNANPITKVDFYSLLTGTLIGTATTAPYQTTWKPAATGTAFLRVTAYDTAGNTNNSAITTVYVVASSNGIPPPPPPPPPANYTVTVTNGTANGATTATVSPGATVTLVASQPPAGQYFKQWSGGGVSIGSPYASTTTFTMPAANVTIAATFYSPPPLPTLAAGHPRLWLRPADVTRLRTWATPANPVYQALLSRLATANYGYQICFPNGQPAVPYPDQGDVNGWSGATITVNNDLVSEQHALVLAFFALIDPDPAARLVHAQKARAMFMYIMNEAAKPHQAGAPWRDPLFSIYCRSNGTGEAWPLLADWLQGVTDANGQPVAILTAADKATIRTAFMQWAVDCLNAYTCGGDHPAPIGITNSPALLPGGNAYRIATNNYYLNHARLITMMPLTLDAADDPLVDPAAPASALGNTLRSYLLNATGAWLYQQYSMFGEPADVRSAYGLSPTAKVGLASGGLATEGGLYGHSLAYVQGQLLALQTAGVTSPTVAGPQISLLGAPVWDRFVRGMLSTAVPKPEVPAGHAYMGQVYQMASFGDLLRLWITPDTMETFALLALSEQQRGLTTNLNAARWFLLNMVEGGPAYLTQRVKNPYSTTESLLYFMLFDPTDPTAFAPADPRPALATTFVDNAIGRALARTDWSPNASFFSFRSGWLSINHQNGDAGQFELYRKGEWLTKELSNYDNHGNGQSTIWHNTLALQNWCSTVPTIQWYEWAYLNHGSQWNNAQSAGDPVTTFSSGTGYTYAETDMTKLYNHPSQFSASNNLTDITHASRSVLWLQPDFIVVYDRATSLHAGLFKRFNLNAATPFVIDAAARRAVATTPKGQKLSVQTLLPANAALSYVAENGTLTNIAQLESMTGRLVVEDSDPLKPTDVRFLHIVQGADTSAAIVAAAKFSSSAGTSYDGAVIGDTAALFPRAYGAVFGGVTYATPVAVTQHYVTGLVAGAGYSAAATSDGTTATWTVTSGGTLTADSAGVLRFTLPSVLP